MMNKVYDKVVKCYESVRTKTDFKPEVALVLGSGLGNFADDIQIEAEIPYAEIEGFPISTVPGHDGRLIFGYVGTVPVVCMKGRVHYYEGYPISDVVLPARLMKLLGAKILFLTNAAGGVNKAFRAGDLMLITDHISCFVPNPLIGQNIDEFGIRFPDMSSVYDRKLQKLIRKRAISHNYDLKEGIYTQLTGPSYETPAEIRMLQLLGTDAVGMSTVVEAMAAHHAGLRVCGISCITNMAAGINKEALSHKEVQVTADQTGPMFQRLVSESIIDMGAYLKNE